MTALKELGAETPEFVTRADNSAFNLTGGTYTVEVSGTFAQDGIISLFNGDGDNFASFTDNGAVSVDLPYGGFYFESANVSDWTGTVTG